ncbi:hypothetical protein C5167_040335 [Papaver somniferum]|uniref:Uncharacterized protein n=1 Tax=Papaver somniferum TaxID=3469 RepID=A0A4Y7IIW5_PAPSO|nr:hypothetical protein C5167_040335 [Papaver somniferum]
MLHRGTVARTNYYLGYSGAANCELESPELSHCWHPRVMILLFEYDLKCVQLMRKEKYEKGGRRRPLANLIKISRKKRKKMEKGDFNFLVSGS